MKTLIAALGVAMALSLSACDNSGTSVAPSYYDYAGNYCGSSPYAGCTYDYAGYKINIYSDPYWSMANFQQGWGYCSYYDEYGCAYYDNYWWSPTGVYYDWNGWAVNSATSQGGRDLLADVAESEEAALEKTGKQLANKYPGLSEAQGVEIARNVHDWEVFTKKQGRTAADYAEFSKRVFKVDLKDAAAALAQAKTGDMSKFEELNADVARNWGTDAETSRRILKDWYRNELEGAGVR
jgi:hypothetical protein